MAKFIGSLGYIEGYIESSNDTWTVYNIKEKTYCGDIIKNISKNDSGDTINGIISLSHKISIVADKYLINNPFNIKYVVWKNVCWNVINIEIFPPRLILTIGGIYNGERPG